MKGEWERLGGIFLYSVCFPRPGPKGGGAEATPFFDQVIGFWGDH